MNKSKIEQLLKTHHRDAFLWARQCCYYNSNEAQEVLQMTYLKILEGKANYNEQSSFKTWLFSVIRFTAIDHSRKQIPFEGLERIDLKVEEAEEPDSINYKELLSKLSERQHQVLVLAFYHNMTLEEIATITELHIGTIRTHYERGKIALRELILKVKNYEEI